MGSAWAALEAGRRRRSRLGWAEDASEHLLAALRVRVAIFSELKPIVERLKAFCRVDAWHVVGEDCISVSTLGAVYPGDV